MEDTIFISAKDLTPDHLEHHGVLGMHWGIRRYQRADGSLTPLGRQALGYDTIKREHSIEDDVAKTNGGKVGYRYSYNRDMNCANCAFAYELRRRGYDVTASQFNEERVRNQAMSDYYKVKNADLSFRIHDPDYSGRNDSDAVETLAKKKKNAQ